MLFRHVIASSFLVSVLSLTAVSAADTPPMPLTLAGADTTAGRRFAVAEVHWQAGVAIIPDAMPASSRIVQ